MQLEDFKAPLLKQLVSGRYAAQYAAIGGLNPEVTQIVQGDCVTVKTAGAESYESLAKSLMPWRKGPFKINDLFIDSEWRSFVKYNLLLPHLNLAGKRVLDVGCNNGYYLFRMLDLKPASLTGFDPSPLFYLQFLFMDRFIRSNIRYELLGVQHLESYGERFDAALCLGVLYHRSDPIAMLKALASALEKGGELILDTLMIEGDGDYCLTPKERYSKIPNIWFIPTVAALTNWLERTGFEAVRVLEIKPTDASEQRKTAWIEGESLESFLNPDNPARTVEGYPAPLRVYISARRR